MRKNEKPRETEMYLCGEEYSKEYQMEGDYFYDSIMNFFGIKKLREVHSGDLSSYLYWMVLGLLFVIVALLVIV